MKKVYSTMIAALIGLSAFAQTKEADRLFENWDYFRAAKLYEKEAATNPSADVYFKLGECYRKMNSFKKEEVAADDKVNAAGPYSNPDFYLNYGQVLKSNGRYEEAKVAFNKFTQLKPSDKRGKFYYASIDTVINEQKYNEPITISGVAKLNSKNADFAPVLYKDGIVFTSNRFTDGHNKISGWGGANYSDLYYAKRGKTNVDFSEVAPFGGKHIDKKYHDGLACFSKNFDTIYISRVEKYLNRTEKKTMNIERNKIYISALKDTSWSKATPFQYNSDSFSVASPFLSPDNKKLFFVSDMPGGYGATDIYYCNREGAGWSKPVNMGPEVNTFNNERFPNMDAAGNFYFASDGYQGFGGLDICVALNKNGKLEKAKPMKYPFNTGGDDYGIIFLKEGRTGYISSNRTEGGQGDDDILYFDLDKDKVENTLMTSIYTIGYRPKQKEITEEKKAPVVIAKGTKPTEKRIYFDLDKANIRPDAIATLDQVINYMNSTPKIKLILSGHCDSRGTPDHNIVLSNQRNESVIQYLNKKGIESKRIVATGYGLTRLANHCEKGVQCTEAEGQANRRVEFQFDNQ